MNRAPATNAVAGAECTLSPACGGEGRERGNPSCLDPSRSAPVGGGGRAGNRLRYGSLTNGARNARASGVSRRQSQVVARQL
jgi:hypothetical protein